VAGAGLRLAAPLRPVREHAAPLRLLPAGARPPVPAPGRRPASVRPGARGVPAAAVPPLPAARPAQDTSVRCRPLPPPASYRAASGRPAPGPLRLTRRGRLVLLALALCLGALLAALVGPHLGGPGSARGDGLELAGARSVVVEPGDTLWSIASSVAGDGDVRAVVDALQEVNHLPGPGLAPGQVLQLP
jgi:nucleoid-associated protein YgaU